MRADRAGNGFRLSGTKTFVHHAHVADLLLVAAETEGGSALFAVPADAAGLTIDPRRLADASLASRLVFEGVEIDADAILGHAPSWRVRARAAAVATASVASLGPCAHYAGSPSGHRSPRS